MDIKKNCFRNSHTRGHTKFNLCKLGKKKMDVKTCQVKQRNCRTSGQKYKWL